MANFKKLSIFTYIILIPVLCFSTEYKDFYFTNIHKEKNLVITYTDCITQDEEGFIWFEYDGLSRFDGNNLVTYSTAIGDSSSINSNSLNYLLHDDKDNLWIATQKGLSKFNTNTHTFNNYYHSHPKTIGSQFIRCICEMDDNQLFIGTSAFGTYILNTKSNILVEHHTSDSGNTILSNHIYKIIKTNNQNYWIATDNGLSLYNPDDNKYFKQFLKGESIRDIIIDKKMQLWVSGYYNENLLVLNSQTGQLLETHKMPKELSEKQKKLMLDSKGMLWIAALDMGLYLYDIKKKDLYQVRNTNNIEAQTFPNPMQVFEDKDSNIWVTTFNKGLFYLDRTVNPFVTIKNSYRYKDRFANATRFVFKDKDGVLWTSAREYAMLSNYDIESEKFENFILPPTNDNKPEADLIWFITDGFHEKLLLGTIHNGLIEFDKRNGHFKNIKFDPSFSDGIRSKSVYTALVDRKNNIWIGFSNAGLDRYNPITGEIIHFDAAYNKNKISNNSIRCIYEDKNGDIWVGTMNGLNKYNPVTNNFVSYFSQRYDPKTLTDNAINDILEDSRHILWIGTYSGFDRFDRTTGKVKRYTKEDGYAFLNTFKIIEDNSGNLWLNGEQGLSKFDVHTEKFENYTSSDGLQNSIYFHNGDRLNNGKLVFGGNKGFNLFDPDNIVLDVKPLETKITGLKLFNETVKIQPGSPLKQDISKTDSLKLNYKDKVITIEFAALCFRNADEVNYAFRLTGFEEDWNIVHKQLMATYTNLAPGNYVFEVKAAKNSRFEKAKKEELFISIAPPFWQTWWAFTIYGILFIAGLYFYRKFLIKSQDKIRREELERERVRFFINISHEFRTPLTLMINPLLEVSRDTSLNTSIKDKVSVAYRSAQKLLQLVTQLQGIRKLEFEPSGLQVQATDIVAYIKNHTAQFMNLAGSKKINLHFKTNLKEQLAYVDIDIVEKILNNLISNSLKYTNEGGNITIWLEIDKNNIKKDTKNLKGVTGKRSLLKIIVDDTGIGISKEKLTKIFERFYQVDSHGIGAGIGLNYVKSLVEAHHGEISVESEVGIGTKFIVSLPFEIKDFQQTEIDQAPDSENYKISSTIIDAIEYDLKTEMRDDDDDIMDNSKSETLLIVEDNKALQSQLKSHLKKNYHILTASNGEEGLQKALKHIPDLIICDVMMPVMDGIEMCKMIKQTEEVCNIPIILLTAKDLVEDRIKGFETGADSYIPKPFYMEELSIRISNMIKGRRRLQEQFNSRGILSDLAKENYENKDEVFLNNVTKIVLENIDKTDFSVKDLYEKLNIGKSHLFNKLTKLTGQNPSRFVRTIRLKYSVELLIKEGLSIKEVSYKAGFNSPPYFTKVFNEFYGCSPSEYVRKIKNDL